MTLSIHRPYPGVALVVTARGSVLLGAPADAFKATKRYCQRHELPFPRTLVASQTLLIDAAPQFNPEFFLYDFLFVHGAAFKPELADERLHLALDAQQLARALDALRITLTGPTRHEMAAYRDTAGQPLMRTEDIERLARVSEHMAIRKGDRPRALEESVATVAFDQHDTVEVLDGELTVIRNGPQQFEVRTGSEQAQVDLSFTERVIPFATLPPPTLPNRPLTFGVKPLGTRSGFDLSGPTTGFLLWLSGRAVIYDGPVGTRYLLESQGISPEDVDIVILSHCHEDHMGAFVELLLAGYRPKVFTAEPVYRSALVKLSSYFNQPPEQVASYIDYHRVVPGQKVDALGATLEFFYTVHAIPTVGIRVCMRDGARNYQVQISGDTMHHEGLDTMLEGGVLDADVHHAMRNLVPASKVDGAMYFADVGEAIIHGHPKDWANNPNDVIYYHCPDDEHTRSFGKRLAVPGHVDSLIEARKLHPATPGRLLSALRFLDIHEPGWVAALLHQGRQRHVESGEVLGDKGQDDRTYSVIVAGTASVYQNGHSTPFTTLRPGDFFGVIELVDGQGKQTAKIVADMPMELFEVDAPVFYEHVQRRGLEKTLRHIWEHRPGVESAKIFRDLDLAIRNRIAKVASTASYPPKHVIIGEGTMGDDFYVLVEGEVEISRGGNRITTLRHDAIDNFFGEISAIYPNRPRSADIVTLTDCKTLRIRGYQLRDLFEEHMGIRYALLVAMGQRSGDAPSQGS